MSNSTVYWASVIIILAIGFCSPFVVDHQLVKRGYILTSVPASVLSIMVCPLLMFIMFVGYPWEVAQNSHRATLNFCLCHAFFFSIAAILVRSYPTLKRRINPDADPVKTQRYYVILFVEIGEPIFLGFISALTGSVILPNLQPFGDWLFSGYPIGYILLLAAFGLGCGYLFYYENKRNNDRIDDSVIFLSEENPIYTTGWDEQNPKYG